MIMINSCHLEFTEVWKFVIVAEKTQCAAIHRDIIINFLQIFLDNNCVTDTISTNKQRGLSGIFEDFGTSQVEYNRISVS